LPSETDPDCNTVIACRIFPLDDFPGHLPLDGPTEQKQYVKDYEINKAYRDMDDRAASVADLTGGHTCSFCEHCNAEKAKLKKFYLLTLIVRIVKDGTF